MNHDQAHCTDYTWNCPKKCYRANLTRELKELPVHSQFPVAWASFRGTPECPLERKG